MSSTAADAPAIARWRRAIDHWEVIAEGSTSSITGGGAIRVLEDTVSARMAGHRCLALGSGTAALAACLIGVGVRPGDRVLTSALDWPAASEAIRWVGATPGYVDVDPSTATIDPTECVAGWDPTVTAVVATHLFGVPADIAALRAALPDTTRIVEDCAQALGARLDGEAVGTLADAAAFSFGPGKQVDAGEAGMAVFADDSGWERAVAVTQHRVRALATDLPEPPTHFSSRIHPMAAVLALYGLEGADSRLAARQLSVRTWLSENPEITLVGGDDRREPALWRVPVHGIDERGGSPLPADLRRDPAGAQPATTSCMRRMRLAHVPAAMPAPGIVHPAEDTDT